MDMALPRQPSSLGSLQAMNEQPTPTRIHFPAYVFACDTAFYVYGPYDTPETLHRFLRVLIQHTPKARIYIVDAFNVPWPQLKVDHVDVPSGTAP